MSADGVMKRVLKFVAGLLCIAGAFVVVNDHHGAALFMYAFACLLLIFGYDLNY